jgi:hypothetical protein
MAARTSSTPRDWIATYDPVAPHEMPFLRDVALGVYARRWAVGVMAGTVAVLVAAGMLGPATFAWYAAVPAVVGASSLRSAVHGRRFLRSVGVTPV